AFVESYPGNSVLLIDTYDTIQGARNAAQVAREMADRGERMIGVRLDSGDMVDLSRRVREVFDEAGLPGVKIFASSGFDEHKIAGVLEAGACIDAFGVGTKMGVSADAPYFDIVYKMVHFRGRNIRKLSTGKANLAGEKQVFRRSDRQGGCVEDIIGVRHEPVPENTEPLLETVLEEGVRRVADPGLDEIRSRVEQNLECLPERYKDLRAAAGYPVSISSRLQRVQEES
ncbi:MAG TPA: nicotinate phosphoribosyltransferase, partial [Desulfosalsimonadaceae bacterium]|nr:nicotinate phosphoribosyltransferase [Desulfosalsimonadaceae bacterium]